MTSHELDQVERPALRQLQSLGWTYIESAPPSPHASGERTSFKEVVLEKRLTASIKRINPWIDDENLHKVVRRLTTLGRQTFTLFHEWAHVLLYGSRCIDDEDNLQSSQHSVNEQEANL